MADYGAQIFINGTAFDVVNAFAPTYMLDVVSGNSGSKTYSVPETTTITAKAISTRPSSNYDPVITISGNTVSWSGLSTGIIFVYST